MSKEPRNNDNAQENNQNLEPETQGQNQEDNVKKDNFVIGLMKGAIDGAQRQAAKHPHIAKGLKIVGTTVLATLTVFATADAVVAINRKKYSTMMPIKNNDVIDVTPVAPAEIAEPASVPETDVLKTDVNVDILEPATDSVNIMTF